MQSNHQIKRTFGLLLLCIFSFQIIISQSTSEEKPIIDVLLQLEAAHNVRFSYNKVTLDTLKVKTPKATLELSEALDYLSQNYALVFTRIEERYIAVQRSVEVDITICGTLIDTAQGVPVKGAIIKTPAGEVQSDEGGKFKVGKIREDALLTVYFEGSQEYTFRAKEMQREDGSCPQIFLFQDLNYLPTVVLESYITKGISKDADGSIAITKKDFELLPSLIEPDVLQIAQTLPGIDSYDETASNINVRGGKNDELLLLWEDIRMYQSGHFFGLISAFNSNLTEQVNIYKNGTHPRFGEGVSGVISMMADNKVAKELSGGVGVNLSSANLFGKIPVSEDLSFQISGRTSINNGIGNPVYKQFFRRAFQNTVVTNLQNNATTGVRSTDEKFNFFDISIKGLWDITRKDKLRYNFLTINNTLQFTERFITSNNSIVNESELTQRTSVNGLSYQRDWSNTLSTKVGVHGSNYVFNESILEVDTAALSSQRNEVDEQSIKVSATYKPNDLVLLDGGYQYTDTEVINNERSSATTNSTSLVSNIKTNAFFLDSEWNFFDDTTFLNLGIRVSDYGNLNEVVYEPRFNVLQKLTDHLNMHLSAEKKSQTIIQFIDVENKLLGVENKNWIAANGQNVPILKSDQISMGGTFAKNSWTAAIEGFYKKVDGVASQNQGFRNQFFDTETTGSYAAKGIELSISTQTAHINAWLSYTYLDNKYTFDALTPSSFRNNLDITHSLRAALTYSFKAFTFSLGSTYHSGIPYTVPQNNAVIVNDNNANINFSNPNAAALDAYFRTDFSAVYDFKIDTTFKGKINLALLNVFDRKNALNTYFQLVTDDENIASVNRIDQFSLGFTPNISFHLLF